MIKENFVFEGATIAKAEILIEKCWVDANNKATTLHTVQTVYMVGEEEKRGKKHGYNHDFDYTGGDIFTEAFASLNAYLADPTT
tara:strand:+ start:16224 stop:16475 length:252 start_codon:yes stop_codon:yes gene_type:complete